ncbi:hypothetical protein CAC42_5427 [Sphaceloma murrayae]|uniref:Uncharacterized protein n=1 Tax=Sphaceloma murrayae TaxID=2082308 RepID=A0A2K1QUZ5_9PEZI|nr:hypothetical protein CAC42_5427 [Sphaceloma murrayae]
MQYLRLFTCIQLLFIIPNVTATHTQQQQQQQRQVPSNVSTANHVFNAIHNSMRQFGSSLNHNGLSFFLATVPQGTEYYHGTSSPNRINDTQWLAFEPEHALIFARPHMRPPKDGKGAPGRPPPSGPPPSRRLHRDSAIPPQRPLQVPGDTRSNPDSRGYLHTYRTRHPLRLLYLDGQSAAKSTKGTLDTQDIVLRPIFPPSAAPLPPSGPMDESARAADLCTLANATFANRIHGILRMEGGFEVILCSFAEHLQLVNVVAVDTPQRFGPGARGSAGMDYYRAVEARNWDIGGGRVRLDYDAMVSVFEYPEALTWDETERPRVVNDSKVLGGLRQEVVRMVKKGRPEGSRDWQAVVDLIIGRYGRRIEYITAGNVKTMKDLKSELELALRPFVDAERRDAAAEARRCAAQFWPADVADDEQGTAVRAVRETYETLCQTLVEAAYAETFNRGMTIMKQLKDWLGWSTWKQCKGCEAHEVCLLPIWPIGGVQDFEQPECVDEIPFRGKHAGYWDDFGGPPPHDGDRDREPPNDTHSIW